MALHLTGLALDPLAQGEDNGLAEWLNALPPVSGGETLSLAPADGFPGFDEGFDFTALGTGDGYAIAAYAPAATITVPATGTDQPSDGPVFSFSHEARQDAWSNVPFADDGPAFSFSTDDAGPSHGNGHPDSAPGDTVLPDITADITAGDPAAAGAAGDPAGGLIFIGGAADAKGGIPGSGKDNGGGKGGGGGDPDVLSEYISGHIDGQESLYNIEIDFKGSWTVDLQQAFIDSSEMISGFIVGDIGDVFYRGKIIDDIRIDAKLGEIDGEGGILGRAGPTAIRKPDGQPDDYLPGAAIMEFDVADADAFNQLGLWDDIVTHEMLHSIGFGTIWGYKGLIDGAGTDNPTFTGAGAVEEYQTAFGGTGDVPVEGDGGSGTRDSHWDEETFDNELMTGYINYPDNYMSDMTVASIEGHCQTN